MSSGISTKEYGYIHRKSMRIMDYDYSRPGAYFITISVQNRECLFGNAESRKMILNEYGEIVKNTWYDLVNHVCGINLDEFVIMSDHIHGIISIVGAGSKPVPMCAEFAYITYAKQYALPETVRQFKTFSARRINQLRKTPWVPVWQRNYYDHIVRNEEEMNNPAASSGELNQK